MKKVHLRRSAVFTTILLTLAVSSVFFSIIPAFAVEDTGVPSMSTIEDVTISESGDARLTLQIGVHDSWLVELYRKTLAAPPDVGVDEEIPIPEYRIENGVQTGMPVRQEFYKQIKREQRSSFGFATWILDSSMVPNSSDNTFRVSVSTYALPQIVNVTSAGGLDKIWEILIGPKDEDATKIAAGDVLATVAFAQMMVQKLTGEQVYESVRSTRIKLPEGATLLNGDELAGLNWMVDFGEGTSLSAYVSMDGPSTIVLTERTVVMEQNFTATPNDFYQAFLGFRVFKIRYLLPNSTWISGESLGASAFDSDPGFDFEIPAWSETYSLKLNYTLTGEDYKLNITVVLSITPSLTIRGHLGWEFGGWLGLEPQMFEAWVSPELTVTVMVNVTVKGEWHKTWPYDLFRLSKRVFFMVDYVPVEFEAFVSGTAYLTVDAKGELYFDIGAEAKASFTAGLRWTKTGGWEGIFDYAVSARLLEPHLTLQAELQIKPGVKFKAGLTLYETAGPFIGFEPYALGTLTVEQFLIKWKISLFLKVIAGITFGPYLKKLLGEALAADDIEFTLKEWEIKSWEGQWRPFGFPVDVSINVDPNVISKGAGTTISGQVTLPSPLIPVEDRSGDVLIQASKDGGDFENVGTTTSNATGHYSYWWMPDQAGTYAVRAQFQGNPTYKSSEWNLTSLTVLEVTVADHAMTHGVDQWYHFPIDRTRTFYADDDEAISWILLTQLPEGYHTVKWDVSAPDGLTWSDSQTFYAQPPTPTDGGYYWPEYKLWYMVTTPHSQPSSRYDKPWRVDIYYDENFMLTETFRIIEHLTSITISIGPPPGYAWLIPHTLRFGEQIEISGYTDPPLSQGLINFHYSTDNITWNYMGSVIPQDIGAPYGIYSYLTTVPTVGTFYLRATWLGVLYYADATASMTLWADRALTQITTTLSANTITYGSSVTISVSLSPPLAARPVIIQYSTDGSNWYHLSAGLTWTPWKKIDDQWVYALIYYYSWTPPNPGVYLIRSTWYGDTNFEGATSESKQLTVESSHPTTIEIVQGANAEADRTTSTVTLGVKVKDLQTETYLENKGKVEFYVDTRLVGADTDTDPNSIYSLQWEIPIDWPTLGPQTWGVYFTGTPQHMPSRNGSTITIYHSGVAIWINATVQKVNVTSSTAYTVNFTWNREGQDTFDLSLDGLDSSWYSFSQPSITVSSKGQTVQVTLTVSPPRVPMVLKAYDFQVIATSQADSSFSVSADGTVIIGFTPTLPATPTGGLAIAVQPKTIYMSPGSQLVINILVINNQNFDDVIIVTITNSTVSPSYAAMLSWFNWTEIRVFIPAMSNHTIPLKVTINPILLGTKIFNAFATSTALPTRYAKDAGIIKIQ